MVPGQPKNLALVQSLIQPRERSSRSTFSARHANKLQYLLDLEQIMGSRMRSALRRIYEQDDATIKRMVICVCEIDPSEGNHYKVRATDGWYCIDIELDQLLTQQVTSGRIQVGTKLITAGADWHGTRPEPCSPLEAHRENYKLRLHGNSTRRARWDAKLGFCQHPKPFPISVSSIRSEGGPVACIDLIVQRRYPMQYMERLQDGSRIFRSEKAEQIEAQRHNDIQRKLMETVYHNLTALNNSGSRNVTDSVLKEITSGEELHELMTSTSDPDGFHSRLTEMQVRALSRFREQQLESAMRDESKTRQVSVLLKMRVTGAVGAADWDIRPTLMLTVWSPGEDVVDLAHEGAVLRIYNVNVVAAAAGAWHDSGNTNSKVNLSANRHSRFSLRPGHFKEYTYDAIAQPRQTYDISALCRVAGSALNDSNASVSLAFKEADCEGICVYIHDDTSSSQLLFISDESEQVICIKVWGGLSKLKLLSVVKENALLRFENLQLRSSSLKATNGSLLFHYNELSCVQTVKKRRYGIGPIPPECIGRTRGRILQSIKSCGRSPSIIKCSTPVEGKNQSKVRQKLAKLDRLCGNFADPFDSPLRNSSTPRGRTRRPGLTVRKVKTPLNSPRLSLSKHRPTDSDSTKEDTEIADESLDTSIHDCSIADLVKTRKRKSTYDSQEYEALCQ